MRSQPYGKQEKEGFEWREQREHKPGSHRAVWYQGSG